MGGGAAVADETAGKMAGVLSGRFSHFRRGQIVRHPTFGLGRIRELEETGEQRTRAVVQFNEAGQKTLILEYAALEVIDE